jgi:hypothetical protein
MIKPVRVRPLPRTALSLLARFPDPVRAVVRQLRSRVLEVMPRAHEVVVDVGYTIALRYGPDDKMRTACLYVTGFASHANLGFLNGAAMSDPEHVLEGSGAAMRHVKFESPGQVNAAKWFDRYLTAALLHAGLSPASGDARTEVRPRNGERPIARRIRGKRTRDSVSRKRL